MSESEPTAEPPAQPGPKPTFDKRVHMRAYMRVYNATHAEEKRAYRRACYDREQAAGRARRDPTTNWAARIFLRVAEGEGCQICGYNKSGYAIDWHHVDRKTKHKAVGAHRSLKAKLNEAIVCEPLCANCHREVEAGLIDFQDYLDYPIPHHSALPSLKELT